MSEIEAVAKLLKELGVASFFSPLLVFISIFFLMRKYLFPGAGDFVRSIASEYLKQNNERVILETKIDFRLGELAAKLDVFVTHLVDWEKRNSERINELKEEMGGRINNIEVVLSDKVFDEINDLRESYEKHHEHFNRIVQEGHECPRRESDPVDVDYREKRSQIKDPPARVSS